MQMASNRENKLKFSFKTRKKGKVSSPVIVDLTFLSSVPKKYCCTLCQNLLQEPCQVSCCKSIYCRDCIDRLTATSGKCANSKCGKKYSVTTDGSMEELKKKIQQLKVYCIKRSNGCKWTGTIEQLEQNHFSSEYDKKDPIACQFQKVLCPNNCGAMLLRGRIEEHRFMECKNEMSTCEYCGMEDSYNHIHRVHHRMCPTAPVECPNKCNMSGIARSEILSHLEGECPLRLVSCDYRHVGCEEQIVYADVTQHNLESYQRHLDLMAEKLEFVSNENGELRKENDHLREEITRLLSKVRGTDKNVVSADESYVIMGSVHIMPLLPDLTHSNVTRLEGDESVPVSPTNSHVENGLVSVTAASPKDQSCSNDHKKFESKEQTETETKVDEGNIYEILDDEKFDTFRRGGASGVDKPKAAWGSESSHYPHLSRRESRVPLPELPLRTKRKRPSSPKLVDQARMDSVYDIPVRGNGGGDHNSHMLEGQHSKEKIARSTSLPDTIEHVDPSLHTNTAHTVVQSGIYEDADKVVQKNGESEEKKVLPPISSESSENIPPTNLVQSQSNTSFDSLVTKSDSGKIPVITVRSPIEDGGEFRFDKSNTNPSQSSPHDNSLKTKKPQTSDNTAAALAVIKKKQGKVTSASYAVPITPFSRARSSTVGDMHSLSNVRVNRKLVDAVKPDTFKLFEGINTHPTEPNAKPALPPKDGLKPTLPPKIESHSAAPEPKVPEIIKTESKSETGPMPTVLGPELTVLPKTGPKPTNSSKTGSKPAALPEAESKPETAIILTKYTLLPNVSNPTASSKATSQTTTATKSIPPKIGSKPSVAPRVGPKPPKTGPKRNISSSTQSGSKQTVSPNRRLRSESAVPPKLKVSSKPTTLVSHQNRSASSLPPNVQPSFMKELNSTLKDKVNKHS